MSTTILRETRTVTYEGNQPPQCPQYLLNHYHDLVGDQRMSWTEHLYFDRILGSGGQGVVYLSARRGADGFTLPVALKIFSPAFFEDERSYLSSMERMGKLASKVASIQHDNLLDVQNFIERFRIRIMEMEWIDGFDLRRLMKPSLLLEVKEKVSRRQWTYINDVIVTEGPRHSRLKPGIVAAIIRECLSGLAALHREEIVHADIKPANIMLKRTGNAKLIDIGSAIELSNRPERLTCSPAYAAPETLERNELTPLSDLASLGYVMIEMLSGKPLFEGIKDFSKLLEAKRMLGKQLTSILPADIAHSDLLMSICKRLIAVDPLQRFQSAEEAETHQNGLAEFQRTLVKGDLAIEAEHDIRQWLQELD